MPRIWLAGLRVLVLGGLAGTLLGCGGYHTSDAPPSRPDSGIGGHTMVGPSCPVMRVASPCPDKPLRARLTVMRADSTVALTAATSDAAGYFRIPLPPGRYTLRPG